MIQMRWLVYDEFGYDGMNTKKVLQYRELREVMNKEKMAVYGSSHREKRWTPWIEVPTVEAENE
jgi:hypothetical protein